MVLGEVDRKHIQTPSSKDCMVIVVAPMQSDVFSLFPREPRDEQYSLFIETLYDNSGRDVGRLHRRKCSANALIGISLFRSRDESVLIDPSMMMLFT